ncbi:MAG: Trehalose utilization protein, partial [Phycisphaerales bacterium]|nr:Trehalose utilization protein [Phycisphaerales bacterium]
DPAADDEPATRPAGHPGGAVPGGFRVLVWDERQPKQKEAYENWLGNAIAEYLRNQPGIGAIPVALDDPDQGLSDETLDRCSVLVWWGHARHRDVLPATGKRIVERIKAGKLSLVALHSAHWSTPFVQAMYARAADDALKLLTDDERRTAKITYVTPLPQKAPKADAPLTPSAERKVDPGTGQVELVVRLPICCFPSWREDGKPSHVTVLDPTHPIAKDLPPQFDIPQTEMYAEPFHVPKPDATLFLEKWDAGEQFHSGMIWSVGKGKVFYFRPGHETYGVYKEALPLKIVENACRWLAAEQAKAVHGEPKNEAKGETK